jgi:hypothetical protein
LKGLKDKDLRPSTWNGRPGKTAITSTTTWGAGGSRAHRVPAGGWPGQKYWLTRPESARDVLPLERGELADPSGLARILESLAAALDEPIADPQDIQSVTIMLRYSDE